MLKRVPCLDFNHVNHIRVFTLNEICGIGLCCVEDRPTHAQNAKVWLNFVTFRSFVVDIQNFV